MTNFQQTVVMVTGGIGFGVGLQALAATPNQGLAITLLGVSGSLIWAAHKARDWMR